MKISDLFESLPLSVAKTYRKQWNPSTYSDLFRNYPAKKDKNTYRLFIPIGIQQTDVKAPDELVQFLDKEGYTIVDYVGGYASPKNKPTSKTRIGKIISKQSELKNKFDNDPKRQGSKLSNMMVVISRHPYDIAGMSTGRGWTSCMNIESGVNKHYVLNDVKEGSIIAYLTDSNDLNLQNPTSRILIKPFVNEETGAIILVPEGKIYGFESTELKQEAQKFCDYFNKDVEEGLFSIKGCLYADSKKHIDTTSQKTIDAVQTKSIDDQVEWLQIHGYNWLSQFTNPSEQLLMAVVTEYGHAIEWINDPSEKIQLAAVTQNGWAIRLIKDPSEMVQLAAVTQNGNSIKWIKNPSERVRLAAVTQEGYAIRFIKNPSEEVQLAAVTQDGYAIKFLENPSEEVQLAAVKQNCLVIYNIKNTFPSVVEYCKKK